jgi:hypothetical protein
MRKNWLRRTLQVVRKLRCTMSGDREAATRGLGALSIGLAEPLINLYSNVTPNTG